MVGACFPMRTHTQLILVSAQLVKVVQQIPQNKLQVRIYNKTEKNTSVFTVATTYQNFAGTLCGVLHEMMLLLPELWAEELALDTFDIVTVEDEAAFNSNTFTSNNTLNTEH